MFLKKLLNDRNIALLLAAFLVFGNSSRAKTDPPATVSFTQDFPGSDPAHYAITLSSDGRANYQSDGKLAVQAEVGSEDQFDFTLSPATTKQIFDLTKKARYFEGEIDSRKNVASTGIKTLTYQDGARQTKASYNYSTIVAVQQLTRLFQDLSSTLEYGRRLQYCYRHQKLALNEELTNMETAMNENRLGDISPVLPILDKIAKDPSVINVARSRAMRISAKHQ